MEEAPMFAAAVAEKAAPANPALGAAVLVALVESSDETMKDAGRKAQLEVVKRALSEGRDLSPEEVLGLSNDPYLAGVLLKVVVTENTAEDGSWA